MIDAITKYVVAHAWELFGFVTTALGIWLTARRKLLCWPITLVADIVYFVVFYRVALLSDTLLQVFFIAFTLYGWWHWWRGVRDEGEVRVEPLPMQQAVLAVAAGIAGTVVLGSLTKRVGAALPYLDALLASFSLVGSWWQARKHIAIWWLWIAVDVLYVGEYIYKDLWLTAVLYAGLVGLAVVGLRDWKAAARMQVCELVR